MISSADSDLITRDPSIPGLKFILDPVELGRLFGVSSLHPKMVRYKPNTSCIVGGDFGYAKAFSLGEYGKISKKADQVFSDILVSIYHFPNDKDLRLDKRSDVLKRLQIAPREWKNLRYNPERRYVGKIANHSVKFYDADSFNHSLSSSQFFSQNFSQGPYLIGFSEKYRWIASRWINDAKPLELSHGEKLGEALKSIHDMPVSSLSEIELDLGFAEVLKFLVPSAVQKIDFLIDRLPKFVEPKVIVHGDFYADQILWADDRIHVLDFDRAGMGEAEFDLGNFFAHLIRNQSANVDQWKAAILTGYGKIVNYDRLSLMTSLGLFRLAMEPFRKRSLNWNTEIERILDLAISELPPPFYNKAIAMIEKSYPGADIKLVREKANRRAIFELEKDGLISAIAKVNAKKNNFDGYHVQKELYEQGFKEPASIRVPHPIDHFPEARFWTQEKIHAHTLESYLVKNQNIKYMELVAHAAYKIEQSNIEPNQSHTLDDEMVILTRVLKEFSNRRPNLADKIIRLNQVCTEICAQTGNLKRGPQHRDFHPGNILLRDDVIWLLDFDLYCEADLGLDIGNFLAHLIEIGIRVHQNAEHFSVIEDQIISAYLHVSGNENLNSIKMYRALSFSRLAGISIRYKDREHFSERLLDFAIEQAGVFLR